MRKPNEAKLNGNGHVIWCPCVHCDLIRQNITSFSEFGESLIDAECLRCMERQIYGERRCEGQIEFTWKDTLTLDDLQFLHACGIDWFGDERSSSENER